MRRNDSVLGREGELEELARVFLRTSEGEGGVLLLVGEAGVGKTRLAEAAVAAGSLDCLRGVATEGGAPPYAPLAAVLRQSLHSDPPADLGPKPLATHLHALLPELGAPPDATDRETLFEALRRAFETISARRATVVFLDDLQWADAATLELLPSLAEAAATWPLLVLGAYRGDEIPRGHPLRRLRADLRRARRLAELSVEPVDPDATARIAARVLGAEPGPTLRAALYDRTHGVPFFVEEVAAALKAGGRLRPGHHGLELDEGSGVPIPESLRDVLRVRADGLSDEANATQEAASVIGVQVQLDLLVQLGCDAGLGEVLDRGLLREVGPGVAAFRHDLVREALYMDTHWPRRRTLHRELGRILEQRGADPGLAAGHWLAGGEPGRARPLFVEAARRSCTVHAYRDAAAAARTALELWPEAEDESERLAVLEQLGRCAQACGELGEARRAWEEVAASLGRATDRQRLAEAMRGLATVYSLEGDRRREATARMEAAEAFEDAGSHADAAAEWLLVVYALRADDLADLERACNRALEAARLAERGDLEARCLSFQGFLASRTGHREEGFALMRTGLVLALAGNHVQETVDAYWALGAAAYDWSDYPAAQSALDDALAHCEANELPEQEHFCTSCLIVVLGNAGEWTRAEQLARDLLDQGSVAERSRAHALLTVGLIDAARGVTKRARRLLGQAHAIARETGMEESVHASHFGLAFVDELEGTASPHWQELVTVPFERVSASRPRGLRLASTFAARRADTTLLNACAEAAASYASRFGGSDALAALAHTLGELALAEGEPIVAAEQFAAALERLGEVEAPFERALTQARAGTALIAAGERDPGVERLTGAYHTFRKLGARPLANRAAEDLQAAGEHVDVRLGRRAARDLKQAGLTRRELEILRLVAVGRTNREIAQQLFVSPRTVDMHVRNMLAKLGCRSRAEATGKAHELGLLESVLSQPQA